MWRPQWSHIDRPTLFGVGIAPYGYSDRLWIRLGDKVTYATLPPCPLTLAKLEREYLRPMCRYLKGQA